MLIDEQANVGIVDNYGKKAFDYLDEKSKEILIQQGKILDNF